MCDFVPASDWTVQRACCVILWTYFFFISGTSPLRAKKLWTWCDGSIKLNIKLMLTITLISSKVVELDVQSEAKIFSFYFLSECKHYSKKSCESIWPGIFYTILIDVTCCCRHCRLLKKRTDSTKLDFGSFACLFVFLPVVVLLLFLLIYLSVCFYVGLFICFLAVNNGWSKVTCCNVWFSLRHKPEHNHNGNFS